MIVIEKDKAGRIALSVQCTTLFRPAKGSQSMKTMIVIEKDIAGRIALSVLQYSVQLKDCGRKREKADRIALSITLFRRDKGS